MAVFLSTYENKLDKKGRVSVPASFRSALGSQSFNGIITYRSHKFPALEASGMDRMELISQSIDNLDMFSDTQDDLSTAIFADAQPLVFDTDGRITLPQVLIDHMKVTEYVLFAGAGPIFRMWEPVTFRKYQEQAREAARTQKLTLKLQPGKDA